MGRKNKVYFIFLAFVMILCSINTYAINSKAIRNTSESVLYGTDKLSKFVLDEMLKEIAKPETNPKIFLVREPSEADKVITESITSIKNKLEDPNGAEFFKINYRVARFLEILETEYCEEEKNAFKVELSFLLDAIDGQF